MKSKGVRQKIAESNLTLLGAILIAILAWMAKGSVTSAEWIGLLATGITAYVLMEFNNSNALIRIRSRMISSVYLVLMAALTSLHSYSVNALPPLCVLSAYFLLFKTYQNSHPESLVFHAFLFIGLGSLIFPQILLFTPFYLLAMIVQLRSLNLRSFAAAIMGTVLPFALIEAYMFYCAQPLYTPAFIRTLTCFPPPDYSVLSEHQMVSVGVVAFLAISAMLHFRYTKFNDKIRTRMFLYMLTVQELLIIAFLVAQPQHFDPLFRLLVMNSSPLIAHHLALTQRRWGTCYFYFALLLILTLAIYNLWVQSQLSF